MSLKDLKWRLEHLTTSYMSIFEIAKSFKDYLPDYSTIPSDIVSFKSKESAEEFGRKIVSEYYFEIKQSEVDKNKWMVYYQKYTPEQQECAREIIDRILKQK